MKPFLSRIRVWTPHYVVIAALGGGLSILLLSCAVGVFKFSAKAGFVDPPLSSREVGYAAAVNWSLTYTILFPVTAYLMIQVLKNVPGIFRILAEQGMVRSSDTLEKTSGEWFVQAWETGTTGRKRLVIGLAIGLPTLLSLGEWFRNNLLRLLYSGPPAQAPDYDWGLAGLMEHWSLSGRLANAFLDLTAFAYEGIMLGSFLAFFLYLMDLSRVLPQTIDDRPLTLIPDLRSEDTRRGFEVFQDLLNDMLVIVFLAYIMSYLVRIEGVYLAGNQAPSLGSFIQSDILKGAGDFFSGKETLGKSATGLFATGGASIQAVLAGFASLVVLCFALIITIRTLRSAAEVARTRARIHYEGPRKRSLCGLPVEEEQERLRTMTVWPLGYLRFDLLLIGALLAIATLVFYRIGLYVTGFVIAGVLASSVNRLRKSLKGDGD